MVDAPGSSENPAPPKSGARRFVKAAAVTAGVCAVYLLTGQRSASRMETACASILNVVNPSGSTFEREDAGKETSDRVVRLLYNVNEPGGHAKRVIILCAFDGRALSGPVPPLVAVALNGRQLGPARLAFLNRFWLKSEQAQTALPATGSAREATGTM